MIRKSHIIFLFLFFSLGSAALPPGRTAGAGLRFFFGPSYGFYSINKNHAQDASSRVSVMAGFRKELRLDREYKTFFLLGLDYFFYGVNFRSYYFRPDTLQLYDKSFGYTYALNMQEINLPVQMKFSFTKENNSMASPYVIIGYHLRYLLPASLNVTGDGNKVTSDSPEMKFRNPLFLDQINSAFALSAGIQKNSINKSTSSFFAELNFRYGFSPYYFKTDYSASSLYMNSVHLSLLLGLKF